MRRFIVPGVLVTFAVIAACVGDPPDSVTPTPDASPSTQSDATNPPTNDDSSSPSIEDSGPGFDANAECNPAADFGADPTQIAGLGSSNDSERHLTLNEDETEAYFGRFLLSSGEIQSDLAGSKRANRSAGWEAPGTTLVSKLNRGDNMDQYPSLANDRLSLFFIQRLTSGDHAIKRASRLDTSAPFDNLEDVPIDPAPEAFRFPIDPFSTSSGLYLAARPFDGTPILRIYRAAQKVGGVGYTGIELQSIGTPDAQTSLRSPVLTFDESTMFFAQREPTDGGFTTRIWVTTKAGTSWSAPSLVKNLNISLHQYPMWISRDGCRLYVSRVMGGGQEDMFLYSRGR